MPLRCAPVYSSAKLFAAGLILFVFIALCECANAEPRQHSGDGDQRHATIPMATAIP